MPAVSPAWNARVHAATAVVAALVLLAFWTRLQFIAMYGRSAYLTWSLEHFFGALSGFYVTAAEAWRRGEPYRDLVYPPGYIAFLAIVGDAFGTGITTLRTVQAAFDALTVAAVFAIARALRLSRAWAVVPAAVYAVLPLWAAGSTFLLADALSTPLLLWMLAMVVVAVRAKTWWPAAAVGLLAGVAGIFRPDLILVVVPAALTVALASPAARLVKVSALVAAFAILPAIWGVHNHRVHGAWVFTSASGGATLWEGLGEIDNPYGYVVDDSAANHVMAAHGYKWASIDGSAFMTREALKAWRDHPGFASRAAVARAGRILFTSERLQPLFFGRVREALDAAGLAALVAAMWLVRDRPLAVMLLAMLPLYAVATLGLVHVEPRYVRYVQVPYVLSAAVVGASVLSAARRRWKTGAAVAVVMISLVGAAYGMRELSAIRTAAITGIVQP